jgi:hypothetical protein
MRAVVSGVMPNISEMRAILWSLLMVAKRWFRCPRKFWDSPHCAALLHVPYEDTLDVFKKIHDSLKPRGIFYACYKQGHQKMTIEERDFYNMDATTILPYFQGLFEVIHMWDSPDATSQVAPSSSKSWFNFLVRKQET